MTRAIALLLIAIFLLVMAWGKAYGAGAIPVAQVFDGAWRGHIVLMIPAEDLGAVIHALREDGSGGTLVHTDIRKLVRRIYPQCGGIPVFYSNY